VTDSNQVTPAGAWFMGLTFLISGMFPALIAFGIITPDHVGPDNAPPWVLMCAGAAFMAAGLTVIVDYAIEKVALQPDGDFVPGTPMGVRIFNLAVGAVIVGAMTAIFGWVAFGPGPRQFTTTIYLPFMPAPLRQRAGEMSGRIAFGFGTIFLAFMFVACTTVGIQRLRRARML